MGDMMEYYNQISELKKAIRERELHRLELEKEALTKTHKREKRYDELKGKVKELQTDILREEAEASQRIQNLMSRIDAVRKEHLLLASHTDRLREKKRAYEMQLANTNPSSKINSKFAPYTPNIYMGLGTVQPGIENYNRPEFQTKLGPYTQIPTNFSPLISSHYPSGNLMGPSAGYMEKNTPVQGDMVENRALEGDGLRDRAYERDTMRNRDSSSLKYMGNEFSSVGRGDKLENNAMRDILRDRPLERDAMRDMRKNSAYENYKGIPGLYTERRENEMHRRDYPLQEETNSKVSYENDKGISRPEYTDEMKRGYYKDEQPEYIRRRDSEMRRSPPMPYRKSSEEIMKGDRNYMERNYRDEEPEYIRRRESEIRRSPIQYSSEEIMIGDRNYKDEQDYQRRRESEIRSPNSRENIIKDDYYKDEQRNYMKDDRNYKDVQDYQRRRESEIHSPNSRENIIKDDYYKDEQEYQRQRRESEQDHIRRRESEMRRSPTSQYSSEGIMKGDRNYERNYKDEQEYQRRRESEIKRSPIQYSPRDKNVSPTYSVKSNREIENIRRSPIQYSPRDKNVSPTYSIKSTGNSEDGDRQREKIQIPNSPHEEKNSSPTNYRSVNEEKHPYSSPLSNRRVDEEKYSSPLSNRPVNEERNSTPLSHRPLDEEKHPYSSPLVSHRSVNEEKYSRNSSPLSHRSVNEEKHPYSSPLSNRPVNEERNSAYSSPLSNRPVNEERNSAYSSPLSNRPVNEERNSAYSSPLSNRRVNEERNSAYSSPLSNRPVNEERNSAYSSPLSNRRVDEEKNSSPLKSHSPVDEKYSSPLIKPSSPVNTQRDKPFMAQEQDDADFFDNTPATASAAYQRLVGFRPKQGSGTESESDGVEGSLAPQNITPKHRDVKPFVSRIPSLRPGPPGTDTDSVDSVEAAIQAAMANREKDDPAPSQRSNPSKNSDVIINQDSPVKQETKSIEKPATNKNTRKKSALNIKLESDEESYGVSVGTEASDEDDFDFYDKF